MSSSAAGALGGLLAKSKLGFSEIEKKQRWRMYVTRMDGIMKKQKLPPDARNLLCLVARFMGRN